MDDIIEKLSLLDYENLFCKGYRHKRISRVYFCDVADGEDEVSRVNYIYDLLYWLMGMNKEKPVVQKTWCVCQLQRFQGQHQ
mmetsp:Transcript_27518/g.37370  ORF Transcript_27518/g.37370 Transcript_27518/m.37370 type:complete len:82 (+) Transcript_27518:152-397(+)